VLPATKEGQTDHVRRAKRVIGLAEGQIDFAAGKHIVCVEVLSLLHKHLVRANLSPL
jgi:hypothetical protein